MRTRLERYLHEGSGLQFYFGWDRHHASMLHVDARGSSVEEAIRTYLEGTLMVYDAAHRRYQTQTETHGIYWTLYNNQPGHVLIISCFRIEE